MFIRLRHIFIYSCFICFLHTQVFLSYAVAQQSLALSVCVSAVESRLDALFRFTQVIIDKAGIPRTAHYPSRGKIRTATQNWQNRQGDIHIQTLLQMAYFLGTHPSTLLKISESLAHPIQINEKDIKQALESRQPLSIEMLKFLELKQDLPEEYISFLKSRSFLPDENIDQLLKHIHSYLKNAILTISNRMDWNLRVLSERTGVSLSFIEKIVYHAHIPRYNVLEKFLQELNIDIITFFENIEAFEEFKNPFNYTGGQQKALTPIQRASMAFIRDRIQNAIYQRDMLPDSRLLKTLIGLNLTYLNEAERDIALPSLFYTSFVSEIPLSVLISLESLEDYTMLHSHSGRSEDEMRRTKVLGHYIRKFEQAFHNFIRYKMNEQDLSISELAINSDLPVSTISNIVLTRTLPKYLRLSRIVQHGFGQTLESFFQEFEMFIEGASHSTISEESSPYARFEYSIDNYNPHQAIALREDLTIYQGYRSARIKNALHLFHARILQAIQLTGLSPIRMRNYSGVAVYLWNNDIGQVEVASIIRVAHFLGITPFELLGHQPLSELIYSENFTVEKLSEYRRLSEEEIQLAIQNLSANIQEQKGFTISDKNIQIRAGVINLTYLNPVLHGESTMNLLRFFQVVEGLIWREPSMWNQGGQQLTNETFIEEQDTAFFNMLEVLFEGSSINYRRFEI